jgi:DNA (cytosine-5)-methyltransferase 1
MAMSDPPRCFDLFCGGGGSSRGAAMAGAAIVGGLDAWNLAADTFQLNFPNAHVLNEKAANPDLDELTGRIGRVDLLLASPECTSHSVAKGNAPRCETSRGTAFEVVRYAQAFRPRWMVIENVPRMRLWARYQEWLGGIRELGYQTCVGVLESQDYRTPQARKRLFLLCDRDAQPSLPPKARGPKRTVASILTRGEPRDSPWQFRPLRSEARAAATLERAERAIQAFGSEAEFIMVYYGSDGAGGFQSLNRPLRTITTLDRFAYVRPTAAGHEMRMLQPPELAAAMGFPVVHTWPEVSRRERIKLIGNAVCPPVMCAVVRHLTQPVSSPAVPPPSETKLRCPVVALLG